MTKLFGIIGNPLGHSFSPEYFKLKFEKLDLPYVYEAFELKQISDVTLLMADHPELCGFNVTSPYKEAILPYLAKLSEEAKLIGAVNTVLNVEGHLHGFNTDVIGFDKVVHDLHLGIKGCLILGTGGASKAVKYVLTKRGLPYLQVSRTKKKDVIEYKSIDNEVLNRFPVIINTTPSGMKHQELSKPLLPYHLIGPKNVLIDLIYEPRVTAFLEEGLRRNSRVKNGYQMLIEQAEASWSIWVSYLENP
jgi:shikimate dehydrogenase